MLFLNDIWLGKLLLRSKDKLGHLSLSVHVVLKSRAFSCNMVVHCSLYVLNTKTLSPGQFITIRHKNNLNIVSTVGIPTEFYL